MSSIFKDRLYWETAFLNRQVLFFRHNDTKHLLVLIYDGVFFLFIQKFLFLKNTDHMNRQFFYFDVASRLVIHIDDYSEPTGGLLPAGPSAPAAVG